MICTEQKDVKTRKPHRCIGCAEMILVGSTVRRTRGFDDNKPWTAYWCDWCAAYYDRYRDMIDPSGDGIMEGDLREDKQAEKGGAR